MLLHSSSGQKGPSCNFVSAECKNSKLLFHIPLKHVKLQLLKEMICPYSKKSLYGIKTGNKINGVVCSSTEYSVKIHGLNLLQHHMTLCTR